MPPPLLQHIQAVLPQHCEPTSPFLTAVSSYLHICLPTPLALISSILGTLSIVSWLFAQLPQIYKNFQLQSTSGLSLFFLVEWCLGDLSNLLGCLLTRQAGWQVIVAGYYVCVDVTLVFQYYWYTHYKGGQDSYSGFPSSNYDPPHGGVLEGISFPQNESQAPPSTESPSPSNPKDMKDVKDMKDFKEPTGTPSSSQSRSYSNEKVITSKRPVTRTGSGLTIPMGSPRTLLLASMLCAVVANAAPTEQQATPDTPQQTLEILGRIISWMSTFLYLGSRPPQLYKNYCRKSTSGLSPLLFMAAFCGNLFYSTSLLTNPNAWSNFGPYGGGGWADADGNDRVEWVTLATPFFLGAFGVLAFDGFMGVQFLMYGSRDDESIMEVEDPKDGRNHWTRVRGWMRGWIPSVSPERTAPPQENQSLLQTERERYGTV
ncbi:PQ loop repeat protein [Aspergillus ellipticus CBS 707.79]|uniref:PQ loop repeat protein n=1 Tax=Aspergillus ellipticus CBS 707.79 TaxID=1448320 RepID=A0A319DNV4_9EURO|nr:PQ loop repeat protein [Aspergillus ellipticus CBS 707.79]